MLWQGQELAESYILPDQGSARINFRRDIHWEYFYDDFGSPLVRLYRILGMLWRAYPALRNHESFYYNEQSRTSDSIVVYSRQSTAAKQCAIVFLNFSDQQQSISIPFPETGAYRESSKLAANICKSNRKIFSSEHALYILWSFSINNHAASFALLFCLVWIIQKSHQKGIQDLTEKCRLATLTSGFLSSKEELARIG